MRIINKTTISSWVAFERSLMRDTRIKSNTKVMYLLFKSLSQSCEKVYMSYSFIAQESGYVYNGAHPENSEARERAMRKFVLMNLEPLLELGWIKKTNKVGESCDWEVYDCDCNPEQKSTGTLNKKVQGDPEQKSSSSYKSIELKEKVRSSMDFSYSEILRTNPNYEMLRANKFPGLSDEDIDVELILIQERYNLRRADFTTIANWLGNANAAKVRNKKFADDKEKFVARQKPRKVEVELLQFTEYRQFLEKEQQYIEDGLDPIPTINGEVIDREKLSREVFYAQFNTDKII